MSVFDNALVLYITIGSPAAVYPCIEHYDQRCLTGTAAGVGMGSLRCLACCGYVEHHDAMCYVSLKA